MLLLKIFYFCYFFFSLYLYLCIFCLYLSLSCCCPHCCCSYSLLSLVSRSLSMNESISVSSNITSEWKPNGLVRPHTLDNIYHKGIHFISKKLHILKKYVFVLCVYNMFITEDAICLIYFSLLQLYCICSSNIHT